MKKNKLKHKKNENIVKRNLKDYQEGGLVKFLFLDEEKEGIITKIELNENRLLVKNKSGTIYCVYLSSEDSRFCFLI